MQFEKGYIYHIYNQGNNKQKIIFGRENYLFFLRKIKTYITPYGDIFAWALMPNHFHLMVLVNETELKVMESGGATQSRTPTKAHIKAISFNHSIGIMLASYTRAIQKQENISGSVFRQKTKAICLNSPNGINPAWFTDNGITKINIQNPEKQYPQICFDYIHQNPIKAKLAKTDTDWEYSSAKDYAGLRDGKLVNKEIAMQYIKTR